MCGFRGYLTESLEGKRDEVRRGFGAVLGRARRRALVRAVGVDSRHLGTARVDRDGVDAFVANLVARGYSEIEGEGVLRYDRDGRSVVIERRDGHAVASLSR